MEQSIIDGNVAIALFDGWEKGKYQNLPNKLHRLDDDGDEIGVSIIELKYHSSWDWLMPVVEKIENTIVKDFGSYVKIDTHECRIYNAGALNGNLTFEHIEQIPHECRKKSWKSNSKIEAVWLCVIKFITWYQTTKLKDNEK